MEDLFLEGLSVSSEDLKWYKKIKNRKTRTRCPQCNKMTSLENISIAHRCYAQNDFIGCNTCIVNHFLNNCMVTNLSDLEREEDNE